MVLIDYFYIFLKNVLNRKLHIFYCLLIVNNSSINKLQQMVGMDIDIDHKHNVTVSFMSPSFKKINFLPLLLLF